jgi:hypothetical protein
MTQTKRRANEMVRKGWTGGWRAVRPCTPSRSGASQEWL